MALSGLINKEWIEYLQSGCGKIDVKIKEDIKVSENLYSFILSEIQRVEAQIKDLEKQIDDGSSCDAPNAGWYSTAYGPRIELNKEILKDLDTIRNSSGSLFLDCLKMYCGWRRIQLEKEIFEKSKFEDAGSVPPEIKEIEAVDSVIKILDEIYGYR